MSRRTVARPIRFAFAIGCAAALSGVGCAAGEDAPETTGSDAARSDTSAIETSDVSPVDDAATDDTGPDDGADAPAADDATTPGDASDAAADDAEAGSDASDAGAVLGTVANLALGQYFSCARLTDGTARCWGHNTYGQLGDGTTTHQSTPVAVLTVLSGALRLAAGGYHACVRFSDDTVKCWGYNADGQLGDGTTTTAAIPVSPKSLTKVVEVAAGLSHTCARLSDATVRCWGAGTNGQIGNGGVVDRTTPTTVTGLANVSQIAALGHFTCARLSDGTVKCWGDNAYGQIGDGSTDDSPTPRTVSGLSGVTQIATGLYHACAIVGPTPSNSVRCWGYNTYGGLGDGGTTHRPTPIAVKGLADVVEIAAGQGHTCARLVDGTVKCWGLGTSGQIGNGATVNQATPTLVSGLTDAVALASGRHHTCAKRSGKGGVVCWGHNSYGQLGDGTKTASPTPVAVVP